MKYNYDKVKKYFSCRGVNLKYFRKYCAQRLEDVLFIERSVVKFVLGHTEKSVIEENYSYLKAKANEAIEKYWQYVCKELRLVELLEKREEGGKGRKKELAVALTS